MSFLKSRAARLGAIVLVGVSIAGLAIAQQPYFRYNLTTPSALLGAGSPLVPPAKPTNDGKLDFGTPGSTAPFTLRALVGEPVSLEFGTIGGVAPVTWGTPPAITSGLQYADGVIFGTPTAPDNRTATFSAYDSTGAQAEAKVTFEIVNAAVSLSQFKPVVRVGSTFRAVVSSNVHEASYQIHNAPGATVSGADASARAAVGGVATMAGTFPLTVSVSRPGTLISGQTSAQVRVAEPLAIEFAPPSVPAFTGPLTVTASPKNVVGTGSLVLQSDANGLRARGLQYSNGTLSGNLVAGPATNLSLKLTDSADDATVTATLSIPEVIAQAAAIVIGESRPGQPIVASTGSSSPAMITTDIPNPICTVTQPVPGITVTADCHISGSPTAPGSYPLAVSIVPGANPQADPVVATATVVINPSLVIVASQPNVTPAPGGSINLAVNTSGVVGTPSFELVGVTPEQLADVGLEFDPTTGAITGTIDPDVSISPTVKVTDSKDNASATQVFTIVSGPATVGTNVTSANLRGGDTVTYQATTNIANATFSLIGAPEYYSIDAQTGVITVVAPEVVSLTTIPGFAVRAQNADRPGVFKQATVNNPGSIRQKLVLSLAETASGRGNVVLTVPFSVSGATNPSAAVIATGTLPLGMSIVGSQITGKPTVPGVTSATLRVTDGADGRYAQAAIEITVTPSLDFTLTSAVNPVGKGTIGTPMSIAANPVNTVGIIDFKVFPVGANTANLPTGVTISATTGAITGTPTASANGTANIRMTETNGSVVTTIDKPLGLAVNAPLNVASTYPTSVTSGTIPGDLRALLHDATAAATTASASAGTTFTFSYADEVTANGLVLSPGQAVTVRNLDTNQTFNQPSATSSSFTASTGRNWSITLSASVTLDSLSLTQGGVRVVAPHINQPGTLTAYVGQSVNFALTGNQGSTNGFQTSGSFSWSATNLPDGLTINETTGVISGTASETSRKSVVVSLVDSRSIPAVPRTFTVEVLPSVSAATELPTITGTGDASALVKLYDSDSYDTTSSAGTSKVSLPAGATWTFTYSQPVSVTAIKVVPAYGAGYPSIQVRNVDDDRLVFQGASSYSTVLTPSGGKTFTVYNYGSNAVLAEFALTNNSLGHVTLPNVAETGQRSYNNGTPASFALRSAMSYETGVPISLTPTAENASGTQTWSMTGTLPAGLGFDATTGRISGTPTETGDFSVTLAVTDSRAIVSVAKPMAFKVMPGAKASAFLPVLSGVADPDFARVALHDANNYDVSNVLGNSNITLAANQTITYTFPEPVQANYANIAFARNSYVANLQIRNETLGTVIGNMATSGYFVNDPQTGYASAGKVYSFRNTGNSPVTIANLAITWGGAYPVTPSVPDDQARIAYVPSGTPNYAIPNIAIRFDWVKDSYNSVIPVKANSSGTAVWSLTGTLPPGMTFDETTGIISGTVTTPGDYAVALTFRDGSGYTAVPKNLTFRIFTNLSASTEVPTLSGVANPDVVRSALMDAYNYDANASNGVSFYTLPKDASITFSYAQVVRANYLHVSQQSGSPVPDIEVRNLTKNTVVYRGAGNNYFSTLEGTNVSEGDQFVLTNKATQAVSLAGLAITFNGAFPAMPSIGIDNYQIAYTPTGAASNYNTKNRLNLNAGSYVSLTPSTQGATGSRSYALVGTTPEGMSFDASTGKLSGTVTTPGDYAFTVTVTDTRANGTFTSVPVPLTVKVFTNVSAATVLPDLSGIPNPTLARAALYDNSNYDVSYTGGISKVTIPNGTTVTFTFPQVVRADYLVASYANGQVAGNFEVRNETLNKVVGTLTSSGYFTYDNGSPSTEGSVFSVRNVSGRSLDMAGLAISANGGYVYLPYVNLIGKIAYSLNAPAAVQYDVALLSKQFLVKGAYYEYYLSAVNGTGHTWTYSGSYPTGMTFNQTTGKLSGNPTEAGEFSGTITATDSRGYDSVPVPVSFRVYTDKTAVNTMPDLSGPTNPGLVRSALYDVDSFDASYATGTSKYTLAPGETITYSYPATVRLDGVIRELALGSANTNLEVRNVSPGYGSPLISGTGSSFAAVNGTSSFEGTVFTVKNIGASAATFSRLALSTGGSAISAPQVNDTITQTVNGVNTSISIRARQNIYQVYNYTFALSAVYGTGTKAMSLVGSLPPGMTFSAATGQITGMPTASGSYPVQIVATDANGIASVPKTFDIYVMPSYFAHQVVPTVTGVGSSPDDARARLMDSSTSTTVNIPAGGTVTFEYPVEVGLNQVLYSGPTASLKVTNVTTGTVVYNQANQASGTKTFTVGDSLVTTGFNVGTVFTVQNVGATAIDVQTLSLSWNNQVLPYPTITANASYSVARGGNVSVNPNSAGTTGTRTWSYTGSLPAEFSFSASTGSISRTGNSPGPSTSNIVLQLKDTREIYAVEVPVTLIVQ